MYLTNYKIPFPGNGGVKSALNIEQRVAKSWWGGINNDTNLFGNQIQKVQTNTSDLVLKLPQKGIYLLQVIHKNGRSVFKIHY